MSAYTYTIFDAEPASSGDVAWPSHRQVEIEADTDEDALDRALEEARRCGETCGAYENGNRLWVLVWDEDAEVAAKGCVTLTIRRPKWSMERDE